MFVTSIMDMWVVVRRKGHVRREFIRAVWIRIVWDGVRMRVCRIMGYILGRFKYLL